MEKTRRDGLGWGVALILLGLALLSVRLFPDLVTLSASLGWPALVVGLGALIGVMGLLRGEPDALSGACVVSGVGLILYYQNSTGDWASWSYAWALIPGFAGVGGALAGLVKGRLDEVLAGLTGIVGSLILTGIIAPIFGGPSFLGPWWPALLIGMGLVWLVRFLLAPKRN